MAYRQLPGLVSWFSACAPRRRRHARGAGPAV